jgi:hypothetical protein
MCSASCKGTSDSDNDVQVAILLQFRNDFGIGGVAVDVDNPG